MANKKEAQDSAPRLPQNMAAECALLGGILISSEQLNSVSDLKPEHFLFSPHVHIFGRLLAMREKAMPIDLITVADELNRVGNLEAAGGAAYLAHLTDGVPRISNLQHYACIVKEAWARRQVMHAADRLKASALDSSEDLLDVKRQAASLAASIGTPTRERAKIATGSEVCDMIVKPRDWLLENLIASKSMGEIFSVRGVGKTYFVMGLGHAVATGGQFLKWKATRARPVLLLDGELDGYTLQQRVKTFGRSDNLRFLCCDMQDDPFPHLTTKRAQLMIEDALGDSELLIIDNLSALAPSSNDREGEDWILIQTWLLELRKRGVASIFLHHAGHAGWARGTTRREDLLDLVIELRHPKNYIASEGLRFEVHFTKTRANLGAAAEPIEVQLGTGLDGQVLWTWRDLENIRAKQVVELRRAGNTFREIEDLTGIKKDTAQRLWRKFNAQPS